MVGRDKSPAHHFYIKEKLMSMNPDELVSFANTFSNRAGGPMVKKKSAAQRRRAKAKSLKNAAYVALGSSAGKKTKNSGGKSTAGSKSTNGKSIGSGKGMVTNKDVVSNKPIVTPANKPIVKPVTKSINAGAYIIPPKKAAAPSATQVKNSKAASTAIANRSAAYVALGSPKGVKKKAPKASGLKAGFFTKSTGSATSANAGPYVMPPKKKTTTTGNGPSKPSASRASSR
jgi:hypothetical protein